MSLLGILCFGAHPRYHGLIGPDSTAQANQLAQKCECMGYHRLSVYYIYPVLPIFRRFDSILGHPLIVSMPALIADANHYNGAARVHLHRRPFDIRTPGRGAVQHALAARLHPPTTPTMLRDLRILQVRIQWVQDVSSGECEPSPHRSPAHGPSRKHAEIPCLDRCCKCADLLLILCFRVLEDCWVGSTSIRTRTRTRSCRLSRGACDSWAIRRRARGPGSPLTTPLTTPLTIPLTNPLWTIRRRARWSDSWATKSSAAFELQFFARWALSADRSIGKGEALKL